MEFGWPKCRSLGIMWVYALAAGGMQYCPALAGSHSRASPPSLTDHRPFTNTG